MHKDEPVLSTDPTTPLTLKSELQNSLTQYLKASIPGLCYISATQSCKGRNLLSILCSFSQISFLFSLKQGTKV